eukprot:TRINITY_DN7437_c0_g2_i1.p1 TRINITY_DN7437_c0_g2~~TRINITY_DN7437_c0_g2_i1.p1  ORF type:complete len:379 (-),score=87.38 TRINITY_DN7437_c0_g2_i1:186-1322(-)
MFGYLSHLVGFDSQSSKYKPPVYQVPRDEQDPAFVLSFKIDDEKGIKEFFTQFGFVVVRDVLTKGECEDTINDIWEYIEQRKFTSYKSSSIRVSRNDPTSWANNNWPPMANEGIVGTPPVFTQRAILNRQNPNLHRVGSIILERPDLFINHDRYGLFRPTRDVKIIESDGSVKSYGDHPEFATDRNVHLDMNPWTYVNEQDSSHAQQYLAKLRYKREDDFIAENNEVGCLAEHQLNIQGLINLADNRSEDGGFHLVPGFHHHIAEWVNNNPELSKRYGKYNNFIVLPEGEPIQGQAIRITCRAGSVVIWDQRVAHGSSPNNSDKARYAQFFKIFPSAPMNPERKEARTLKIAQMIESAGCVDQITELGKKMFGLADYP